MFKQLLLVLGVALFIQNADAGVFDLPVFLEPGAWSVGLEPEIVFNNGSGAGLNLKPKYGVNDHLNIQGTLGVGSGSRKLRVGGTASVEWFPDFEKQPGIATPFSALYTRYENDGLLTLSVSPLFYKTFSQSGRSSKRHKKEVIKKPDGEEKISSIENEESQQTSKGALGGLGDFTPFVSVPLGFNIRNSFLKSYVQLVLGSLFRLPDTDKLSFSFEGGFNVRDTFSYVSAGATYYF